MATCESCENMVGSTVCKKCKNNRNREKWLEKWNASLPPNNSTILEINLNNIRVYISNIGSPRDPAN
ncbi:MAG: hypothetical protein ACFFCI_02280 [Promethearchaeota archaeon]